MINATYLRVWMCNLQSFSRSYEQPGPALFSETSLNLSARCSPWSLRSLHRRLSTSSGEASPARSDGCILPWRGSCGTRKRGAPTRAPPSTARLRRRRRRRRASPVRDHRRCSSTWSSTDFLASPTHDLCFDCFAHTWSIVRWLDES